jgi:hypothetical protein
MTRKCKKCGKAGHNARTCGREDKPAKKSAGEVAARACKKCGKPGHNARTCGREDKPEKKATAPARSATVEPAANMGHVPELVRQISNGVARMRDYTSNWAGEMYILLVALENMMDAGKTEDE